MLLFWKTYSNPVLITLSLIKHYKLNVSNSIIDETIQNHLDYPSLLSISDSLNKWNLPNVSFEVSTINHIRYRPLLLPYIQDILSIRFQLHSSFQGNLLQLSVQSLIGWFGRKVK